MANKKVGLDVELKASDVSALGSVDRFISGVEKAKARIAEIKANGGIGGIAVDSDKLNLAEASLTSMAANLVVLNNELTDTRLKMSEMGEGSAEFDKLTAKAAALEEQILKTNTAAESLPSSLEGGEGGGGGLSSGGARAFNTAASFTNQVGLSGLSGPLQIAGEITRLSSELPKLGSSLAAAGINVGAMGAVLAPIGGLALGVAVGMKILDAELEKSKQDFGAAITAQDNYYKALGTMTTEQVKKELATRQAGNAALQQQINETQAAIDSAFNQAAATFGDAGARVLDAAGKLPTAQLRDDLAGLQSQMTVNVDTATRYQQALDAGAFAANDAAQAEKDRVAAIVQGSSDQTNATKEAMALVKSGSTEQLNQRRQEIAQEQAGIQVLIDQLQPFAATSQDATDKIAALRQQLQGLSTEDVTLNAFAPQVEATNAANQRVQALQAEAQASQQTADLIRTATVQQVQDRQAQIKEEEAALKSVQPELEALAQTSDAAATALAANRTQLSALQGEFQTLTDAVLPAARARQIAQGLQEEDKAQQASSDKIVAIRQQAAAQEASIETQLSQRLIQLEQQRSSALAAAIANTASQISQATTAYMQSESQAWSQFTLNAQREAASYKKDRLREIEDLNDSLGQAEQDNDVVGFLRTQAEGTKKLQRESQDEKEKVVQERQDFARERQLAREQFDQKIADLRTQGQAQIDQINKNFDSQEAQAQQAADDQKARLALQVQAQVDAENKALQGKLDAIQKQYDLETKMSGKQNADLLAAKIDTAKKGGQAETTAAQQTATNKSRIETLAAQQTAQQIQASFLSVIAAIQAASATALSSIQSAATSTTASSTTTLPSGSIGSAGKGPTPTPLAEGGIARAGRAGLGLFEPSRSYDEAIIPLNAQTLQKFMKAGDTYHLPPITIGSGNNVTYAEVEDALQEMADTIAAGISRASKSN